MVFWGSLFEGKFPLCRRTFEELARAGWEAWGVPIFSGGDLSYSSSSSSSLFVSSFFLLPL
jgi:hypothetical protein